MLRDFFTYYRPYKKLFLLDFTCAVVAGLLELGFPISVNQFVDKLLPGKDWSLIAVACAALLGIYIFGFRILWWKRAYKSPFSNFLISVEKSSPKLSVMSWSVISCKLLKSNNIALLKAV